MAKDGRRTMNRVFIKICGITCLEDAVVAVEAGADALGFNFWSGSPRRITPQEAARITANLGSNTVKVGVFVDPGAVEVTQTLRSAGLDLAQIHGPVPALTVPFWQAVSAGPDLEDQLRIALETSPAEAFLPEAFLIDTPAGAQRGGTGRVFDWRRVRGLPGRIVLAGGLAPDNVAQAIREARPWGVDACSRLESTPGRKDPAQVRAFIQAVRKAEAQEE
jgi:phosphoribosylanthranilate isomerase